LEKWIGRKFDFDFPASEWPRLIERLRGAPERLAELVAELPASALIAREGESWSIQENAGHLADVETLFLGRLDDYQAGEQRLRPADMSNAKTFRARHNQRDIASVVIDFREQRCALIERLERLEPRDFEKSAIHPRLDRPMRLCDMLYFQAEHDNHHLNRIRELIAKSRG